MSFRGGGKHLKIDMTASLRDGTGEGEGQEKMGQINTNHVSGEANQRLLINQRRKLNTVLDDSEQELVNLTNHDYYDAVWDLYYSNSTRKGSVEVISNFSTSAMESTYPFLGKDDESQSAHPVPMPPNGELAICHLLALWRYSTLVPDLESGDNNGLKAQSLGTGFYGDSAGALMAAHHFNHGDGTVVRELDGINERCSVRFTMEFVDSYSSLTRSVETISEAHRRGKSKTTTSNGSSETVSEIESSNLPRPCAVLGPFRSAVSAAVGVITGVYDLPQVSPVSSSPDLDNQFLYPLFSRLVPSDAGTSLLTVKRLVGLGVKHVGVINVNEAYGNAYQKAFKAIAEANGMTVAVYSFNFNFQVEEIQQAVQGLASTGYRYFFGIIFGPEHYDIVMTEAYKQGIAGHSDPEKATSWIFAGGVQRYVQNARYPAGSPLALATAGTGMIQADGGRKGMPGFDRFMKVWRNLDDDDVAYFNTKQPSTEPYHYHADSEHFKLREPERETLFAYDAVVALGLAACKVAAENEENGSYFNGPQHFNEFVKSSFEGASGHVRIDSETTSRDPTSALYVIFNAIANEPDEVGMVSFTVLPSVVFEPKDASSGEEAGWNDLPGSEFIFANESREAPPSLPLLEVNKNYIGTPLRAIGLTMSALVVLISICFAVWTFALKKDRIVMASQPIFLILICVGTATLGLSIIPMSIDDSIASQRGCDIACMASPWLFSIGFVLSFSALFSKTWRINKIYHNRRFKRLKVTPKDVMAPLVALMSINLFVLLLWSILSPLQWQRQYKAGLDRFGRPKESYGSCTSPGPGSTACLIILITIDAAALLVANFQAYRARKITTEFSESRYIQIAVVSILQAGVIGVPMSIIVYGYPPAFFFVVASFTFISSMSIACLIFVPKMILLHKQRRLLKSQKSDGTGITSTSSYTRGRRNHEVFGVGRSAHMSSFSNVGFSNSMLCSSERNIIIRDPDVLALRAAARMKDESDLSNGESSSELPVPSVSEEQPGQRASILKSSSSDKSQHANVRDSFDVDDVKEKRTSLNSLSNRSLFRKNSSSAKRRSSLPIASFDDEYGHLQIDRTSSEMDKSSSGSDSDDFGMRILENPVEEELKKVKLNLLRTARQLSAREKELLHSNESRNELATQLVSLILSAEGEESCNTHHLESQSEALLLEHNNHNDECSDDRHHVDTALENGAGEHNDIKNDMPRRKSHVIHVEKAKMDELLILAGGRTSLAESNTEKGKRVGVLHTPKTQNGSGKSKRNKVQFEEDCLLQELKIVDVRDNYDEDLDAIIPTSLPPSSLKEEDERRDAD